MARTPVLDHNGNVVGMVRGNSKTLKYSRVRLAQIHANNPAFMVKYHHPRHERAQLLENIKNR